MKRPIKIRNLVTGRTRSYGHADAALARVMYLSVLPDQYQAHWVYEEDGQRYDIRPMIETMRTIIRIYDLGTALPA